jgi:hypothetical protein
MERHKNEIAIVRGEITEESKQRYDQAVKTYEKLLSNTQR